MFEKTLSKNLNVTLAVILMLEHQPALWKLLEKKAGNNLKEFCN